MSSQLLNHEVAAEQLVLNNVSPAKDVSAIIAEYHDPASAHKVLNESTTSIEYVVGSTNKKTVTPLTTDLTDAVQALIAGTIQVLQWSHIRVINEILFGEEGLSLHSFTRLKLDGKEISGAQLQFLNVVHTRFLGTIYAVGEFNENSADLNLGGVSKVQLEAINKEIQKQALTFLGKHGDKHIKSPIRAVWTSGELFLDKSFNPKPYIEEYPVSVQVAVVVDSVKNSTSCADLILKTSDPLLKGKNDVTAEFCHSQLWHQLVSALDCHQVLLVTLHATHRADGTTTKWTVANIDGSPQPDLLAPEQGN